VQDFSKHVRPTALFEDQAGAGFLQRHKGDIACEIDLAVATPRTFQTAFAYQHGIRKR